MATSCSDTLWLVIEIIIAVILGVSILLDLVYWQKRSDKKLRKPRFRYSYYIGCAVNDIRELHYFRKYFGVKTPAFLLVFGFGKAQAHESITNWGYLVGKDYVDYINAYEQQYRNYRDYVDLGLHWGICGELLEIINSGRAVDVQSALSVVDTRKHRERVENYAREQAAAAQSAAEAAWAEAAANSAKDANRNLEKIRNDLENL